VKTDYEISPIKKSGRTRGPYSPGVGAAWVVCGRLRSRSTRAAGLCEAVRVRLKQAGGERAGY
jgi:hypothetical protein